MIRERPVQNRAKKIQDLNKDLVGCSPNALSNKSSLVERKCCCFIKIERQRMNFVCCLLEGLTRHNLKLDRVKRQQDASG